MIEKLLKIVKLIFALSSFICTSYIILEMTYFLSVPKLLVKLEGDPWINTSRALLTNMLLITLFIIQHSVMATESFKNLLSNLKIGDISRSIYCTATFSVLWAIINYWQTTSDFFLWNINLNNNKSLFYLFSGVHVTAWIIIYVANICTDVTELLGLKQIYYSLLNLPDPNERKSYQYRKLTTHMRHPSFLGFILIFWIFPFMTLDRVLLATILTIYMYTSWNTDGEDYDYQKYMFERKYHELKRLNTSHITESR